MLIAILVLLVLNTLFAGLALYFYFRFLTKKQVFKPTQELADFLDDFKVHGYGVIRLDPDSLMHIGVRGRR